MLKLGRYLPKKSSRATLISIDVARGVTKTFNNLSATKNILFLLFFINSLFYLSFALSCSILLPFNASWSVVLICLFVSFFLLLFGCTKDLGYLKLVNYITLHYITLHYTTLQYTTLHYITLHYITICQGLLRHNS